MIAVQKQHFTLLCQGGTFCLVKRLSELDKTTTYGLMFKYKQ